MLWMALRIALRSMALRDSAATLATTGSIRLRYCSKSSSSLRLRSTRRISPSAACESLSSRVTKVPPLRPRRDSTMPAASSMRSACWMVGRPTPNMPASSRSAGSDSPGLISRSEMWRRICSATYACARSCWMRSKRTPVAASVPSVLTATHRPRPELRDVFDEVGEQLLAALPDTWREPDRLFQQSVGVDAITVQLVAIGLDPAVHDLRRHLGVELQPEAPSDDIGLRPDLGVRDQPRLRRKRERVEVPLEPRACGDEVRLARLDVDPADLGAVGAKRLAAHRAGEKLTAKAEPQHRHVSLDRFSKQVRLSADEGLGVVERGELRTERRDHVVVARVVRPLVEVDAMYVDLRALRIKPFAQVSRRRRLFVLQDQRLEPSAHATGLASSLLSSSFATCCSAPAYRSTISASSASVLVNGGANS